MTISLDRFEAYQRLAEPICGPIWIDKNLNIPKWWQRLILSLFGRFECVRKYFNIDYNFTCTILATRTSVFEQSRDARLVRIFNNAVRNFNNASGQHDCIEKIAEPAEQTPYSLTEKEVFTLHNILCRCNCNRADQLLSIDSMRVPEIQAPKVLRLLLENCPNLTVFKEFNNSFSITSEHLQVLQNHADRVTGLFLSKSSDLSAEDLTRLQSFRRLTHFGIYNQENDSRLPAIILGMTQTNWQRVTIEGAPFTADQLGRLPQGGTFSATTPHTWRKS